MKYSNGLLGKNSRHLQFTAPVLKIEDECAFLGNITAQNAIEIKKTALPIAMQAQLVEIQTMVTEDQRYP